MKEVFANCSLDQTKGKSCVPGRAENDSLFPVGRTVVAFHHAQTWVGISAKQRSPLDLAVRFSSPLVQPKQFLADFLPYRNVAMLEAAHGQAASKLLVGRFPAHTSVPLVSQVSRQANIRVQFLWRAGTAHLEARPGGGWLRTPASGRSKPASRTRSSIPASSRLVSSARDACKRTKEAQHACCRSPPFGANRHGATVGGWAPSRPFPYDIDVEIF